MAKREPKPTDDPKPEPGTLAEMEPDADPAELDELEFGDAAKVIEHAASIPLEERKRDERCFVFGHPNVSIGYKVPIGNNEKGVMQYDSLVWESGAKPWTVFDVSVKRDAGIVEALLAHMAKGRGDVLEITGRPSVKATESFDNGLKDLFAGRTHEADPVASRNLTQQRVRYYQRWYNRWISKAGRAPAPVK